MEHQYGEDSKESNEYTYQSNEIERIQKRALRIIYKEDDYDKCLQTAELVSLKERRDQICIQLIKSM